MMVSGPRCIACLALLGAVATGLPARARDPRPATRDAVIFGRDEALWSIAAPGEEPEKLLPLPWPAEELTRLRVAGDGSALLLQAGGLVAWSSLDGGEAGKLRFLPCGSASELSSDGNRVVCATRDEERIAVYRLRPELGVEIIEHRARSPLFFTGAAAEIVAPGENEQILALGSGAPRVLAAHRPDHDLVVSPDGERALGAYDEGDIDIVYTFRLDGKATKRTLVHAARSLHISANSSWAAVQQERDACAVRIMGGQYMCWRRYRALQISSKGRTLLLARKREDGHELFLGHVRGTRARKPTSLVEGAAPVAAFWPRP